MKKLIVAIPFVLAFCFATVVSSSNLSTVQASEPASSAKCYDILKGVTLADFDFYLDKGEKVSEAFQLKEGVLTLTTGHFGWLAPKKVPSIKNLSFRVEYSFPHPETTPNSGVLFRITRQSKTFLPACLEVQLKPGETADLYTFHDCKMSGDAARWLSGKNHEMAGNYCKVGLFRDKEKKGANVWNSIEVLCYEGLVVIRVNDEIVNWAHNLDNVAGRFAFQTEGGAASFRNAVLTPLK